MTEAPRSVAMTHLEAAIARSFTEPFVWGARDCILWCADIVAPALGYDPAARWRGRYRSALGYRRVLRNEGFGSFDVALTFAAADFGWVRVSPFGAAPCDLGIIKQPAGNSCVLKHPSGLWVGFSDCGVGFRADQFVLSAWSLFGGRTCAG